MVPAFPVRAERDVPAVRGPAGLLVVPLAVRQLPQVSAVRVHGEDVELALIAPAEDDAVQGGPVRRGIVVALEGDPLFPVLPRCL